MKKVLVLTVGLMLLATSASAYGPAAFAGLWIGEPEGVDEFMTLFGQFELTQFFLPSDNGISVAEYKCAVEGATVVASFGQVLNPAIQLADGMYFGGDGIKVSLECQYDWFAMVTITLGLYSPDPGYIAFMPHGEWGTLNVGGCDPMKTLEDLNPMNKFGLNQLGIVDNETSTWGAIKSLISE